MDGHIDGILKMLDPDDSSICSDTTRVLSPSQVTADTDKSPPSVPGILGAYRLQEMIGTGGTARVFRATQVRTGEVVALKVVDHQRLGANEIIQLKYESQISQGLTHRHIVSTSACGTSQGFSYLAMELIDGADARKIVASAGQLAVDDAIRITCQAAMALEYMHGQGLVHRDVKPSNLMVDQSGNVKLIDMGLSHAIHGATRRDCVFGTLDYLAPELSLAATADERSDIYSLGCTLYFLLTGQRVFPATSPMQSVILHREARVPDIAHLRPDVSSEMRQLLERMLAKRAEDRPQSMSEIVNSLEDLKRTVAIRPAPHIDQAVRSVPDGDLDQTMPIVAPTMSVPNRRDSKTSEWKKVLSMAVSASLLLACVGGWFAATGKDAGAVAEVTDSQRFAENNAEPLGDCNAACQEVCLASVDADTPIDCPPPVLMDSMPEPPRLQPTSQRVVLLHLVRPMQTACRRNVVCRTTIIAVSLLRK
ncbi:MAG: serine/threonine protein kinase [Planctomycetales bacterium]|nr:serine/threonine protein kinase [Planctomycetales bacterium]